MLVDSAIGAVLVGGVVIVVVVLLAVGLGRKSGDGARRWCCLADWPGGVDG